MAVADTDSSMNGIGTNPGLIIRAPDYVAEGAEIVYGSSYLDGRAVRGKYTGQVLMETEWFDAGTFNNIVYPTVYVEGLSSITGASSSAISYVDRIDIKVYKRFPGTNASAVPTTIYCPYINKISNQIGSYPNAMVSNLKASTTSYWFDIRYEYKLVVSVGVLTSGAYLDIEGLYIQYQSPTTVQSARQYRYTDDQVISIPVMEGIWWGATTDASGAIIAYLGSEYIDGTGGCSNVVGSVVTSGSAYVGGGQKGIYNYIDSCHTTVAASTNNNYYYNDTGGLVPGPITTAPGGSIIDGGLWVKVWVAGLHANSVYKFYTTIIGYRTASVI
jgi:hypothetical protein